MSSKMAPIEGSRTRSYWRSIVTISFPRRDAGRKSRFFHTPALNAPITVSPSEYRLPYRLRLVRKKTRMLWLPDGKQIVWGYDYSFWHDTWKWRTAGQTDRRTNRHHTTASAALMHSTARQNELHRHRHRHLFAHESTTIGLSKIKRQIKPSGTARLTRTLTAALKTRPRQ